VRLAGGPEHHLLSLPERYGQPPQRLRRCRILQLAAAASTRASQIRRMDLHHLRGTRIFGATI